MTDIINARLTPDAGLRWHVDRPGLAFAVCGEEQQGRAVARMDDMLAVWSVDMLPADPEPRIWGYAETLAEAQAKAEEQVRRWPALIVGARRDP